MPETMLIADSGSTKTAWCLIRENQQHQFETQGISLYFLESEEIKTVLEKELLPKLGVSSEAIQQIYFYGTGLAAPEKAQTMKMLLSEIFLQADIDIEHDLTGAARALCLHEEGLACILGTGSGACYFDGGKIVKSSPGLGFILGDEGSGAYLGKMLIQRYLYKTLDTALAKAFEQKYHLSKADILKSVYQESYPNRYLASFARFLGKNRGNEGAEAIIDQGIKDFLLLHIKSYEQSRRLPIHFVGGVADAFRDVIVRLCVQEGFHTGRILRKPMDGLIEYHLN